MPEKTDTKIVISKRTQSRFKSFIKSFLKDEGVDGDLVHSFLDDVRKHISKELAGKFLMDLIATVDDPDGDITEEYHWFGPVHITYFNGIFTAWYKFLENEAMQGYVTFDLGLYDKLDLDKTNKEKEDMKISAMNQMLLFRWHGTKEQNKKAKSELNMLYKWMKKRMKEKEKNE